MLGRQVDIQTLNETDEQPGKEALVHVWKPYE